MFFSQRSLGYFLALLAATGPSLQDVDPVADFCTRWGHRTAVVNNILYTDGGMATYISSGSATTGNVTNTFFFNQPLSSVASSGMPQLYNNITKPGSAPSTLGGAMWGDDYKNVIYFYGGEYTNTEAPSTASLWQYDITHDTWSSVSYTQTFNVNGLAHGGSVSPPGYGYGYYYGGWLKNTTSGSWTGPKAIASPNLLIYNMDNQSWYNASYPEDGKPRAEGAMVFLPMSDKGMLLYFGGVIDLRNGSTAAQPMSEILLYNIGNPQWFTQKATGDVPGDRRLFCAGAAWAEDRSSYNIYLYGGASIHDGPGYDDVYVLSVPSFRWIQIPVNGTRYKNQATCDMVTNNAQMLVIGGSRPTTPGCDDSNVWAMHNLDTGEQNTENAYWLSYVPTKTQYNVPTIIDNVIGGSGLGAATLRTPEGGFDNSELGVYMTRTASPPTRVPTSATSTAAAHSGDLSGGAIAGIAVGAIAGVLLLGAIAFFLVRRRYIQKREKTPILIQTGPPAGPMNSAMGSMQMHSQYGGFPPSLVAPPNHVHVQQPQQPPPLVELPTEDTNNYASEAAAAVHLASTSPALTDGSATVTANSMSPLTPEDNRTTGGYGPRPHVTSESPVYARAELSHDEAWR